MNKHFEKIKNGLFDDKALEDAPDSIIVEALLKGENVVIPDFGYLEPKSLSGRQTVLFKSAGPQDAVMKQFSDESDRKGKNHLSAFYDAISAPLKEGQTVSLPDVGTFQPLKKADGTFRVSFTLSSALRKLLNGEQEKETVTTVATATTKEEASENEVIKKPVVVEKTESETVKEPVTAVYTKPESVVKPIFTPPVRKIAQKGDVIIPQDEEDKTSKKNLVGILLVAAAIIAVLIVSLSILFQNKKEGDVMSEPPSQGATNLPYLAEQHYGNPIFWVYIYEANQDKLTSPVNIPVGVDLVIPDLSEYNVDVTDSMEIKRARVKSDLILNRKD
jgi:nucleoid DNA-binding protein